RFIYVFDIATIGFALMVSLLGVRSVRLQWRLTEGQERSARQRADDLARVFERFGRLNDAAATTSQSLDERTQPAQLARIIADRARELTGADYAGIGFLQDRTHSFDLFVSSGNADLVGPPELLDTFPHSSFSGPLLRLPVMSEIAEGHLFLARRQ